ncbi:hypothetical protein ACVWZM_002679 [Bradyrhizobium sp. USDA 4501]
MRIGIEFAQPVPQPLDRVMRPLALAQDFGWLDRRNLDQLPAPWPEKILARAHEHGGLARPRAAILLQNAQPLDLGIELVDPPLCLDNLRVISAKLVTAVHAMLCQLSHTRLRSLLLKPRFPDFVATRQKERSRVLRALTQRNEPRLRRLAWQHIQRVADLVDHEAGGRRRVQFSKRGLCFGFANFLEPAGGLVKHLRSECHDVLALRLVTVASLDAPVGHF